MATGHSAVATRPHSQRVYIPPKTETICRISLHNPAFSWIFFQNGSLRAIPGYEVTITLENSSDNTGIDRSRVPFCYSV
jgi:hypothetical protein